MTESSILGKLLVDCEFIFGNWISKNQTFQDWLKVWSPRAQDRALWWRWRFPRWCTSWMAWKWPFMVDLPTENGVFLRCKVHRSSILLRAKPRGSSGNIPAILKCKRRHCLSWAWNSVRRQILRSHSTSVSPPRTHCTKVRATIKPTVRKTRSGCSAMYVRTAGNTSEYG